MIVSGGAGLGSRLMSVSSVMITELAGQPSDMAGITTDGSRHQQIQSLFVLLIP